MGDDKAAPVSLNALRGRQITLDEILSSLDGVKHWQAPTAAEADGHSSFRGSHLGRQTEAGSRTSGGGHSRTSAAGRTANVKSQREVDIRRQARRETHANNTPGTIAYDTSALTRAAAALEAVAIASRRSCATKQLMQMRNDRSVSPTSRSVSPHRIGGADAAADDVDDTASSRGGSVYGGGFPGGTPRCSSSSTAMFTPRSARHSAGAGSSSGVSLRSGSQRTHSPSITTSRRSSPRHQRPAQPRPSNPLPARLPSPSRHMGSSGMHSGRSTPRGATSSRQQDRGRQAHAERRGHVEETTTAERPHDRGENQEGGGSRDPVIRM
jgi:hypothetical protein